MAKFTFTAESDDLHEIAHLINGALGGAERPAPARGHTAEEAAADVGEPQPEIEKQPVRQRQPRKPKDTPSETESSSTSDAASAGAEGSGSGEAAASTSATTAPTAEPEHPMLASKTLEDIKNKANEVLSKNPKNGAAIMERLKADFGGAAAFSAVQPADYDRLYAMLDSLA